jgi:hypothetical protein
LAEPSISTNLHLPESMRTRLDILLFSPLEGRVPKGAYQRFFLERLHEFFGQRQLDLSSYLDAMPGERIVRGSRETLDALEARLAATNPKEVTHEDHHLPSADGARAHRQGPAAPPVPLHGGA